MALGAGAQATLAGEVAVGTSDNTYTLAGITSAESTNRQDPTTISFVTTDAEGHLAAASMVIPPIPPDVAFCTEPAVGSFQCGTGASGVNSTAVGQNAKATQTNATAFGNGANASAANATALGQNAAASSAGATATGMDASASGVNSAAYGVNANAAGSNSVALGNGAQAAGGSSISIGTGAFAAGPGDVAVGQGARVEADNGSSFGAGATVLAGHTGSTAVGAGATTTRANQVMMGTTSTTYTMAGLTSNASKAAVGTPTRILASNTSGDLAAYSVAELGLATTGDVMGLQTQINSLGRRDKELTEGIAAVAALAQPMLLPGQHFAMRAGWGGYDDANAFGFSAAGVVAGNLLSQGRGTLTLDGGVGFGTNEGEVAGRAGASFGW